MAYVHREPALGLVSKAGCVVTFTCKKGRRVFFGLLVASVVRERQTKGAETHTPLPNSEISTP